MNEHLLPGLAMIAMVACGGSGPERSCRLADEAVERVIARKVKELDGHEYCQFRSYDAIHDFDGDRVEDLAVTFHVEGPHGGGNHVLAFLLVFLSSRAAEPPLELAMGERGTFLPVAISSDGRHMTVSMQKWIPGDPLCCPSGEGEIVVAVDAEQGALRRLETR